MCVYMLIKIGVNVKFLRLYTNQCGGKVNFVLNLSQ